MIEDRRAANLDKEHRALYGSSGGYLRRLREERRMREVCVSSVWRRFGERERKRESECVCVCVCEREREKRKRARERERKRERRRERERE